jgi:hypothetical protein
VFPNTSQILTVVLNLSFGECIRQQQLCAAGNAMTVPVVGAVCLGILQNLHSSGLIFCHGVPRSLQERFERHSRLAEISRLRREIAILDGLAEEIEA